MMIVDWQRARVFPRARMEWFAWCLLTASPYLFAVFGAADSASFWKRGSFRSGSKSLSDIFDDIRRVADACGVPMRAMKSSRD
jgi:hypothetical protein